MENCLPKQVDVSLVDKAQRVKDVQDCTDTSGATIECRTEDRLEVLKVLPIEYHKWASIFSREQTKELPNHCDNDHRIKSVKGAEGL